MFYLLLESPNSVDIENVLICQIRISNYGDICICAKPVNPADSQPTVRFERSANECLANAMTECRTECQSVDLCP